MNSPLVHESSAALADLMLGATAGGTDVGRAEWMIRHLFGREAREGEAARAELFVSRYGAAVSEDSERKAWAAFARALFASNESLYIE
jgi:hypothetical protein